MDFKTWKKLLHSEDSSIRSNTIEIIPEAEEEEIYPFLLAALDDPNDMVRVSACDMLGLFRYEPVREKLKSHWEKESDDLVREYCIASLGMVGTIDDFIYILNIIKTTKNQRIKSFAISGLLEGMQFEFYPMLIENIANKKNELGRVAANFITEILTALKISLSEVEEGLEQRLKMENNAGEIATFQDTLKLVRAVLNSM